MTKISSTSSIRSKRIHSSFVERTRTLGNRPSAVDPVNPVTPVTNNINYSSANHLMASDAFYDKLEELEKEYLNFYHSERNLQKAIEDIEENMDLDIKYMKNLIDKYNKTILSLEDFDKQLGTNHINNIKDILKKYESNLDEIEIYIDEYKLLKINEDEFKDTLIKSKNRIDELLHPIRDLVLKLYRGFRNIKVPNKDNLESKYTYFPNGSYNGILLDKKS